MEYVIAAYAVIWTTIIGYGVSLWIRFRQTSRYYEDRRQ